MTYGPRSIAAVVLLLSINLFGIAQSIASAQPPGAGPPPGTPAEQRAASPGPGFAYDPTGPCGNAWRDLGGHGAAAAHEHRPDDGGAAECVHADFDPGVSGPNSITDGVETFELAYTNDLAQGRGYCSGSEPGNRFRVLYVTTTNRADRYSSLASTLRSYAQKADYWVWKSAQESGASRHIRYKCNTDGTIEVVRVILSAANFPDSSFSQTVYYLRQATYDQSNRKYLAFVDWAERDPATGNRNTNICGRAQIRDDDQEGQANLNNTGNQHAIVYLGSTCSTSMAMTAMHEIGHVLGGVQKSAPRHDGQNTWHPRDEADRMAYGSNTYVAAGCLDTAVQEKRFDCNKNDYFDAFSTGMGSTYLETHWNTARNKFLVGGGY